MAKVFSWLGKRINGSFINEEEQTIRLIIVDDAAPEPGKFFYLNISVNVISDFIDDLQYIKHNVEKILSGMSAPRIHDRRDDQLTPPPTGSIVKSFSVQETGDKDEFILHIIDAWNNEKRFTFPPGAAPALRKRLPE